MAKLSGSARTYLRGLAHHLKPVVYLGKNGLTENFIASVDQALDAHELIKLKFNSFKTEKKTYAKDIEERTKSELIGLIGNIAIYYREHHDPEKHSIHIPDDRR